MERERGSLHAGGLDVGADVGADDGDIAGLEPMGRGGMRAGALPSDVPRADGRASRPASGPDETRVARADRHAGFSFPRIQIFRIDHGIWLEVVDPFQPRDVDQDTASEDPVLEPVDAQGAATVGLHGVLRDPVVQLAVAPGVAERIEMRVDEPVIVDGVGVRRSGAATDAAHLLTPRAAVVNRLDLLRVTCERDRNTIPDQGDRFLPLLCRDEIQGAQLVVGAPTPPVRQLLDPGFERRFGHGPGLGGGDPVTRHGDTGTQAGEHHGSDPWGH